MTAPIILAPAPLSPAQLVPWWNVLFVFLLLGLLMVVVYLLVMPPGEGRHRDR